ncbi:MAG: PA2779 family protein [Ketobacteraceae bacterium]|nr:PA2779 family protein [Ketobacteraceae bacterium]
MKFSVKRALTSLTLSLMLLHSLVFAGYAQAAMISTQNAIQYEQQSLQKAELLSALEKQQVQEKLIALGVDVDAVKDRVAVMTAEEVRQMNSELNEMPAGQDLIGALVFVFLVFVITDMLCATNIYSFVNCVNR